MNNNDAEFEQRVRTVLDESVANLDGETRRRLAANRKKAFQSKPALTRSFARMIPAAAFAACTLLAVMLVMIYGHQDRGRLEIDRQAISRQDAVDYIALQNTVEPITLLELLTNNSEDREVTSDPDFYVWLDGVLLKEAAVPEKRVKDAG